MNLIPTTFTLDLFLEARSCVVGGWSKALFLIVLVQSLFLLKVWLLILFLVNSVLPSINQMHTQENKKQWRIWVYISKRSSTFLSSIEVFYKLSSSKPFFWYLCCMFTPSGPEIFYSNSVFWSHFYHLCHELLPHTFLLLIQYLLKSFFCNPPSLWNLFNSPHKNSNNKEPTFFNFIIIPLPSKSLWLHFSH